MSDISLIKRREIVDALRRGTVPHHGLETFAVGLDRFTDVLDEELGDVATGGGGFKAIRGDYGTGKTFFSRWLEHRARARGYATALVQISETDTPLHRFETIYRRALESMQTREWTTGAFRNLVDRWFFDLEEEAAPGLAEDDPQAIDRTVGDLLERRLASISATQPLFSAALRAIHRARVHADQPLADGLLAWLMGQPNVSADIKRAAGIKGDLDDRGASGFFRGLLALLHQTGRCGLLLVLDEVETIQRVRSDSREKSLNALRQLIDDLDSRLYPGLYVVVTGTPQFFDGPQGVRRSPPLHQRLHVDFSGPERFDTGRGTQLRLGAFDDDKLLEVGRRVRELYPARNPERIATRVPDSMMQRLARGITGKLGGKVGVAPRIFLRKLVLDLLDKVDAHPDYDPAQHYELVLNADELTPEERAASGLPPPSIDDIAIALP